MGEKKRRGEEKKMVRRCKEREQGKRGRTWGQVRRTGCVPVERMAAGQISVTPKSSLLKGPCGGRREEQDEGGIACGTHPFYRGHHQYTQLKCTDTHLHACKPSHTILFPHIFTNIQTNIPASILTHFTHPF